MSVITHWLEADELPRCQHCPHLADERSFMCEECSGKADEEVDSLREQLRGAVAECDAAKACFALVISDIASSEAQAYELGKRYMERALRAVGGGKA